MGLEQEGVLCSHWGAPNSFGQGCLLMTKMCFALVIDNLLVRDFLTDMIFKSRLWEVCLGFGFGFFFPSEDDVSHD